MVSFSGSFPLEFISFYLDMSCEDRNEATPEFAAETPVEESAAQKLIEPEAGQSGKTRVDAAPTASNKPEGTEGGTVRVKSTSSPSTDESISAYIERTLQTLGCQGTGFDITFLHPTDPVSNVETQELETKKASQSDPIPQVAADQGGKASDEEESDRQTDVNSEAGFSTTKVEYFQTDTSDVEELLDSSGAETTKDPPILIPLDDMSTAETEVSKEAEHAPPGRITDSKFLSPSWPLSASARTLINQHFAETNPSILPVGHSTVAFNQGQVHSILRSVSSETLISSVHLMKNMLEEAMKVGARTQSCSQGTSRPKIKGFRKQSKGSPKRTGQ